MKELPEGWAHSTIAEIAFVNPKTLALDNTDCAFSPMQCLGVNYRGKLGFEIKLWGQVKKAYTHFQDGDVLMAKVTPCFENGKAGIANNLPNKIGAGSSEFMVIRSSEALINRYLLAWLSSNDFRRRATVAMTGSVGLKRVPKEFVLSEQIPLAPLPEQKRIADKLDATLARVDACRERLARVAPLIKRFRQSVLAAATSGQLTADWRLRLGDGCIRTGQEDLGINESAAVEPLPKKDCLGSTALGYRSELVEKWGWKFVRADSICAKVQSGGTPKAGFSDSGIPFLKVYNIVNQKIDFDYRPQFVSETVHSKELAKSQAISGDVVMNIVGPPLGKVAIIPPALATCNINQAITLFRPSKSIQSQWLYIILCGGDAVASVINETKGSVGQVNISLSQCRAFTFPVPPPLEQTEIVRRVETLFAFADRLEARLSSANAAADRLTPALLAKAFRGELVPQNPEDEPASELLKRLTESKAQQNAEGKRPRKAKS